MVVEAKFDDLSKLERLILGLSKYSQSIEDRLDKLLFDLTEEGAMRLKEAILNNNPSLIGKKRFRSITRAWKNEKKSRGWNLTPLNRTASYANAIKTEHSGDGVHKITLPQGPYDDGERTYKFTWRDLGLWLENGTRTFRAIKHWAPTRTWILRELRQRLKKVLLDALFRR